MRNAAIAALACALAAACTPQVGMQEACQFSNTRHCLVYRDYMTAHPGATEEEYHDYVKSLGQHEYDNKLEDAMQRQYEAYDRCVTSRRYSPGSCYRMLLDTSVTP